MVLKVCAKSGNFEVKKVCRSPAFFVIFVIFACTPVICLVCSSSMITDNQFPKTDVQTQ